MHGHHSSPPSVSQCSAHSVSDDQISITSSEYLQGGTKWFGLRKQNLSHDRTCLWIMVIFPPLCSSSCWGSSLCKSAISYEVAIVLCQRNERAGTSSGAWCSALSLCMFWSCCTDVWKQRRLLMLEMTAAAPHIINRERDHLLEWPDNGWKLPGIFSGHAD